MSVPPSNVDNVHLRPIRGPVRFLLFAVHMLILDDVIASLGKNTQLEAASTSAGDLFRAAIVSASGPFSLFDSHQAGLEVTQKLHRIRLIVKTEYFWNVHYSYIQEGQKNVA